ncbi:hypothetical protein LDG_5706 [Legionella drancourtii LLAP12]|uniref:Uncharacterized protein n=1 Tax=Legionella drancourtii LLAP12 TaxID=658187 RepID=G9EKH2_9GAMM|nr:hypothetical protein LDG_5706 [Legionella drancourtii LLAP12]
MDNSLYTNFLSSHTNSQVAHYGLPVLSERGGFYVFFTIIASLTLEKL